MPRITRRDALLGLLDAHPLNRPMMPATTNARQCAVGFTLCGL